MFISVEGRVGAGLRSTTERVFKEALEESVQGVGVIGLQRLLAAARVGRVRFVSCAEVASGKAHVWKSDTVTWCGRRWVHLVADLSPEAERCSRCLRAVAIGVSGGAVQVLDP